MAVVIIPNPIQGVNVLNFPSPQAISGTVSVSNFPTTAVLAINAAQEMNGQLQRTADLLEASILELRVISAAIAQLNDGTPIDPDDLRSDLNLSAAP